MTMFHTTIKKNGRKYYYFRPSASIRWRFSRSTIRLSDDIDLARLEMATLLAGVPSTPDREPSREEFFAARRMFNNARGRAAKRGLVVSLDIPAIVRMMRAQEFRCCVTQLPFNLNWREGRTAKRNAYAPSLDRLDNALGYTAENCRMVLAAVNYGMNEWGLQTFLEIAKAAYFHGSNERNGSIIHKPVPKNDKPDLFLGVSKEQETPAPQWWAHQGSNLGPDD